MPPLNHTHKYKRERLRKSISRRVLKERIEAGMKTPETDYIIYRCALPDCSHYVPKHLADGRKSICWECGNPFVLRKKDLQFAKPVCQTCIDKRDVSKVTGKPREKGEDLDVIDDMLSRFLPPMPVVNPKDGKD